MTSPSTTEEPSLPAFRAFKKKSYLVTTSAPTVSVLQTETSLFIARETYRLYQQALEQGLKLATQSKSTPVIKQHLADFDKQQLQYMHGLLEQGKNLSLGDIIPSSIKKNVHTKP